MKRKLMAIILCFILGSACICSSNLTAYGQESLAAKEIVIQDVEVLGNDDGMKEIMSENGMVTEKSTLPSYDEIEGKGQEGRTEAENGLVSGGDAIIDLQHVPSTRDIEPLGDAILSAADSSVFTYIEYEEYIVITGLAIKVTGELEIPQYINGKPVTKIGSKAFYWSNFTYDLTKVTVPEGVTEIGVSAFESCWDLEEVVLSDGLISIGNYAFASCSKLSSIEIPDGLTSIGNNAFESCGRLSSIEIPESVKSLGENVFSACINLTDVTLNEGITSIPSYAFSSCFKLSKIKIPNGVTLIDENAFKNCEILTKIELPDGLQTIGNYAFYGCSALESITVPKSVIAIDTYSFGFSTNLKTMYGYTKSYAQSYAHSKGIAFVTLSTGLDLLSYAEYDSYIEITACDTDAIGAQSIPERINGKLVTTIGMKAFYECDQVTKVTLPKGITIIGDYAFGYCDNLELDEIPDGTTYIGAGAFYSSGLKEVIIPDTVSSIGKSAFSHCADLTNIVLPESITSIEDSLFYKCQNLSQVNIPESVTKIGKEAFSGCYSLKNITIPQNVKTIGDYAFQDCIGFVSISVPDGTTTIGSGAFQGCTGIMKISIPDGVTTIGSYAFYGCENLAVAEIPESVKSIDSYAFSRCSNSLRIKGYDGSTAQNYARNNGITFVSLTMKFTDVSTDSSSANYWMYPGIKYVFEKGIMSGKSDAIFDPTGNLTREEFCMVLYSQAGLPEVNYVFKYPDIFNGKWYSDAVIWASNNNIVSGYGNGYFGLGDKITRCQLAVMLYSHARMTGADLTFNIHALKGYADNPEVPQWAEEAMKWAVTQGIISGKGNASSTTYMLDPNGNATRAECAAMMKKYLEAQGL